MKSKVCVPLLLTVHAGLLAYAAAANSVTFDEFVHLPGGLAVWKFSAFSISCLAPPLLRLWASAPALLAGAQVPAVESFLPMDPGIRYWKYGEAFLRMNFTRYHELFLLARWAMIPISCLGGWIVYRWARELYGRRAGLVACALYVLCPNVAAHGSLVTTDIGITVAILGAAWLWWRFCRSLRWTHGLPAGLAVALAHLCKFTALALWPILMGMGIWFSLKLGSRERARRLAGGFLLAIGMTLPAINLAYGFRGTGLPIGAYSFRSEILGASRHLPQRLPIPLPRDFVIGADVEAYELEGGNFYLLGGEVYRESKWYTFPLALIWKLPLSTLLLALMSLLCLFYPALYPLRVDEAPLLAVVAVGMGLTLFANSSFGFRHLLPLLPFLFILLGRLWAIPADGRSWLHRVLRWRTAFLITLLVENLSVFPRYLTFFNAASGGPANGWRLLNDSNFDWGQGLIDLKHWMARQGVARIQLAYFGAVDPGVYGIPYTPLAWPGKEDQVQLTEELIGVSSYYLAGLMHRLPTPMGPTGFGGITFYKQLQQKRPVAVVGSCIFIYRRSDVEEAIQELPGPS